MRVNTIEAEISALYAGSGPPLLLLHGFPQSSAMWHDIAPELAHDHTVVLADLRGYGDSAVTNTDPLAVARDHAAYSFRAMAADQLAVMQALGHEQFAVVGHDRGARVAHRLALDAPAAVERLALIDVLPTGYMYDTVDRDLATAYYHWFLFIQPEPVPELLMSGDPISYLHTLLGGWGGDLSVYDAAALAEYERHFADSAKRHTMMEDYRAAAAIDLEHDRADADRFVDAPTLIMWGARSVVARHCPDPLAVWRERATDVRSAVVDAGHFLVEERPAETLAALRGFLQAS